MDGDYTEQLSATALGMLAETTGMGSAPEAPQRFSNRPKDIRLALASPAADALLDPDAAAPAPELLRLAIAVHRTAEEICTSGWIARDASPIDLPLLHLAGQGDFQHQMVGLLASFLPAAPVPASTLPSDAEATPGSADRLRQLVELTESAAETERAGALRLLGDEALFASSVVPASSWSSEADDEVLDLIDRVMPRALRNVPEPLWSANARLLDIYLVMGTVWYRMAAQNLLVPTARPAIDTLAREFHTARRFLVRVAQGPLEPFIEGLFDINPARH